MIGFVAAFQIAEANPTKRQFPSSKQQILIHTVRLIQVALR